MKRDSFSPKNKSETKSLQARSETKSVHTEKNESQPVLVDFTIRRKQKTIKEQNAEILLIQMQISAADKVQAELQVEIDKQITI